MDAKSWRTEQRRLREAVRALRRTPDGRDPLPARPALRAGLTPPDLLARPGSSDRALAGSLVVTAKRTLQRLLGPIVLEPQTQYNRAVAAELASLREQLAALTQPLPAPTPGRDHVGVEIDYLGFEERFRGSNDAIAARQAEYLDSFFECGEVLDIGCGRGEFLAMLGDRGISARGVDLDPDMIARCRAQGLAAECADAVEYLERQPDAAFGGVFMSQVVEHLTTEHLLSLLDAIRRKTSAGAVLIIETINPGSLPVLMRWFWLDPTHVRLVHPETLQFFMEKAGFEIRTVQFRRDVPENDRIPRLALANTGHEQLAEYNSAIDRINAQLFGALDYFVVGKSET